MIRAIHTDGDGRQQLTQVCTESPNVCHESNARHTPTARSHHAHQTICAKSSWPAVKPLSRAHNQRAIPLVKCWGHESISSVLRLRGTTPQIAVQFLLLSALALEQGFECTDQVTVGQLSGEGRGGGGGFAWSGRSCGRFEAKCGPQTTEILRTHRWCPAVSILNSFRELRDLLLQADVLQLRPRH